MGHEAWGMSAPLLTHAPCPMPHWQARFNEIVLLGEMRCFDEARAELAQLKKQRPTDPDVQRLEQALASANTCHPER